MSLSSWSRMVARIPAITSAFPVAEWKKGWRERGTVGINELSFKKGAATRHGLQNLATGV